MIVDTSAQQFPPPTQHNWPVSHTVKHPPMMTGIHPINTTTIHDIKPTMLPPPPTSHTHTLQYNNIATWNKARASSMILPHGPVNTPVFMPVGTQGSIKSLTSAQIDQLGYKLILGNTYHLSLRPTAELIDQFNGLHSYINWSNNLLTDSGGFQMVSLIELAVINEQGVEFQSPVDGSTLLLTPEKSIELQNQIGADIIMMLDDVCSSLTPDFNRFIEASDRTIRWLDRCIVAHSKPDKQNLFAIVQGGLDVSDNGLRAQNLADMLARDQYLPGYAIGGLAGGEDKHQFWRVVAQCCDALPANKPRYLMGVGYPVDLVICSALGVDMYDCVWPCRTARFGTAIVKNGLLQLNKQLYRNDLNAIDSTCGCTTCQYGNGYSRSYLCSLIGKDTNVCTLVTVHNLYTIKQLMNSIRQSIIDGVFDQFVLEFMRLQYPTHQYPKWCVDALHYAGIDLPVSNGIESNDDQTQHVIAERIDTE